MLTKLFEGLTGYLCVVTTELTGEPTSQRWFAMPHDPASGALGPEQYINLRKNEDVYISTYLYPVEERTGGITGTQGRAVWVEADTCPPENFRLPPTITLETSPGKFHCWWLLDDVHEAADIVQVNRIMYEAHKDEGADRGWHEGKILRAPRTTNHKYTPAFKIQDPIFNDVTYSLEQLRDAYADITLPKLEVSDEAIPTTELSDDRLLELEQVVREQDVWELYNGTPAQDRSTALVRFQCVLFRAGLSASEVYHLSKLSANNKFGNRAATLWKTTLQSEAKVKEELDAQDLVMDIPNLTPTQRYARASFLTNDERANLPETFIDRYAEWVASLSDSAPTYQRTMAVVVLSNVFGDRAYLPYKNGDTNLCVWAAILGPSTRVRKTTAINLMEKVTRELTEAVGYDVYIGSDVTKEGLSKVLSERDGMTSMVSIDEFQTQLEEMFTKSHLSGVMGYYTKLYNGDVEAVLRASKDRGNTARASTVFNLVVGGIKSQFAGVLTKRDFESGFLARMVWAVAEAPTPKREDLHANILPFGETAEKVIASNELTPPAQDLIPRLVMWGGDKDNKVPVAPNVLALERFNQWSEQLEAVAQAEGDVMMTVAERLRVIVMKTAALLAAYDGTQEIRTDHILKALEQAEFWYNDAAEMIRNISASGFERKLDEILAFVAASPNQERTNAQIHNAFRERPADVRDYLTALKSQGRLMQNATKWRALV